jgi:phosphoribosyl 1,2-cyclic phosphodiesterase
MSLYIASLSSGSNANCYYIGNNKEGVLIDAGLNCRELENRMKRLGLDLSIVKAIFISHEHTDHISGLPVIIKKFRLPVYITPKTLRSCPLKIEEGLVKIYKQNAPVRIGELSVTPFRKSHDAEDPHSFMVSAGGVNVGIITDIGYACHRVIRHFKLCDAVFLETNYCDDMLAKGTYPAHLKKRISSNKGHLSNHQALELFLNHRPERLQLLILSHLSQNNNHPSVVKKLFTPHAGAVKIEVASRHRESELFYVEKSLYVKSAKSLQKLKQNQAQLPLFE